MPIALRRNMSLVLLAFLLILAGCDFPGMIPAGHALPAAVPTPTATPLPPLRMPQDEAPHADLIEWWYYTGHLQGTDSAGHLHQYGFEVTFFQVLRGNLPPIYIGHYAVSDLTTHTYAHASQTASLSPTLPSATTGGFHLAIAGWTMQGYDGQDALHAAMPNYTLSLSLHGEKTVVLENGDGILQRGSTEFSYYYSRTRMAALGTLIDHGTPIAVTGLAWMDHQWGNFVLVAGEGWDWFSIQLDNNTEYMVFFLNVPTMSSRVRLAGATFVHADGTTTAYTGGLAETNLAQWTSPATHITYPMGWHLIVPGAQLTILPEMMNQEFTVQDASGQAYWEGASSVTALVDGKEIHGQAYSELTGYTPQGHP